MRDKPNFYYYNSKEEIRVGDVVCWYSGVPYLLYTVSYIDQDGLFLTSQDKSTKAYRDSQSYRLFRRKEESRSLFQYANGEEPILGDIVREKDKVYELVLWEVVERVLPCTFEDPGNLRLSPAPGEPNQLTTKWGHPKDLVLIERKKRAKMNIKYRTGEVPIVGDTIQYGQPREEYDLIVVSSVDLTTGDFTYYYRLPKLVNIKSAFLISDYSLVSRKIEEQKGDNKMQQMPEQMKKDLEEIYQLAVEAAAKYRSTSSHHQPYTYLSFDILADGNIRVGCDMNTATNRISPGLRREGGSPPCTIISDLAKWMKEQSTPKEKKCKCGSMTWWAYQHGLHHRNKRQGDSDYKFCPDCGDQAPDRD